MSTKLKREQQRKNRFGLNARCQICGETDPATFEKHHLLGSGEGEIIILCRNCHAKVTDGQLDLPAGIFRKNRDEAERAFDFFTGLGVILTILAGLCFKYVNVLYNKFHQIKEDQADEKLKNSNPGTYGNGIEG